MLLKRIAVILPLIFGSCTPAYSAEEKTFDAGESSTNIVETHLMPEETFGMVKFTIPPTPSDLLRDYLVEAALSWSPAEHHVKEETYDQVVERYNHLVSTIVTVVMDPNEIPLPRYTGPFARHHTALFMLAQATMESDLSKWVEDGRCNDAAWRNSAEGKRLMRGDCDYSITPSGAWGIWQMHLNEQKGFVLTDGGWKAPWAIKKGENAHVYHGIDAIKDEVLAARIALRWMLISEDCWGSKYGAIEKASRWEANHPF